MQGHLSETSGSIFLERGKYSTSPVQSYSTGWLLELGHICINEEKMNENRDYGKSSFYKI